MKIHRVPTRKDGQNQAQYDSRGLECFLSLDRKNYPRCLGYEPNDLCRSCDEEASSICSVPHYAGGVWYFWVHSSFEVSKIQPVSTIILWIGSSISQFCIDEGQSNLCQQYVPLMVCGQLQLLLNLIRNMIGMTIVLRPQYDFFHQIGKSYHNLCKRCEEEASSIYSVPVSHYVGGI